MKDQIFETYNQSLNELNQMKKVDEAVESAVPVNEDFINLLEKIADSETLFMENPATDGVLVLSPETNIPIYESVMESIYGTLYVGEAHDETPQDAGYQGDDEDEGTAEDTPSGAGDKMFPKVQPGNPDKAQAHKDMAKAENYVEDEEGHVFEKVIDEDGNLEGYLDEDGKFIEAHDETPEDEGYEGDPEDEGTADYEDRHPQMKPNYESYLSEDDKMDYADDEDDEDEEEEEEEETKESIDPSQKDDIENALMEMLQADSIVIRTHLDEDGWIINNNSPYFEHIQNALIDQFSAVCEAFEDYDLYEDFFNQLYSLKEYGMGIDEKAGFIKRAGQAVAGRYQKLGLTKKIASPEAFKKARKVGLKPKEAIKYAKQPGQIKTVLTGRGKAAVGVAGAGAVGAGAYGASKLIKRRKTEDLDLNEADKKMDYARYPKAVGKHLRKYKGRYALGAAGLAGGAYGAKKYKERQSEDLDLINEKVGIFKRVGQAAAKRYQKIGLTKKIASPEAFKKARKTGLSPKEALKYAKQPGKIKTVLTGRGKAAVGVAGAGVVGGGAYAAKKLIAKRKMRGEAAETHQKQLLNEQNLDEIAVATKVSAKIAKALGRGKVARTVGRVVSAPLKYKKTTALVGAGAAGFGLRRGTEKEKTAAFKKGVKLASEGVTSAVGKGAKAVYKYGIPVTAGAVAGRYVAKRKGKAERRALVPGAEQPKEMIRGLKASLKGKAKAEKAREKTQAKIARIRGGY